MLVEILYFSFVGEFLDLEFPARHTGGDFSRDIRQLAVAERLAQSHRRILWFS